MTEQIKITKLEAAKRQLETAITLYFNDKDPVSIHALVSAAHEIIEKLNKKTGGIPLILEGYMLKEEYREDFRKRVREAKNFFKHADKDPNKIFDFKPEFNDHYLIDACCGYERLSGEKNLYVIIYAEWFNYTHPHILNLDLLRSKIIENRFGNDKNKFFTSMLEANARKEIK